VISIGFHINTHFCGEKIVSVSINSFSKDCSKCGKKSMNGCCKDIQSHVGVSENNFFKTISLPSPIVHLLFKVIYFTGFLLGALPDTLFEFAPKKMGVYSIPIFIKNCTFVI
jgi:hypothetical protein